MTARRGVLGLLAGGAAALLSGCGLFGGNSYRFRMTVEVETPQGVKTGSSVYAVRGIGGKDLITGGKTSRTDLRGEAAVVDLGGGRMLFALLRMANGTSTDDHLAIMSMRAMDPAYANNKKDSAQRIASGSGLTSPAEVAPKDYPMFITFADISEPKTVKLVHFDSLDDVFEAGVQLRRVTVQLTDKPVTLGIERRLSWLPEVYHRLRGVEFNPPGIPVGDFKSLFSSELSK